MRLTLQNHIVCADYGQVQFRCPGGRTDHELYGGNLAAGQTEERAGMLI